MPRPRVHDLDHLLDVAEALAVEIGDDRVLRTLVVVAGLTAFVALL